MAENDRPENGHSEGGELLSIGEFARRGRLTLLGLGICDASGLLRPRATDPWSGYRH